MNDLNLKDEAPYTLPSYGKVISVSLETVETVQRLQWMGANEARGG